MHRCFVASASVLALALPALGQSGGAIPWQSDVKQAIEQARQTDRPLMFYTSGRSEDRPNLDNHRRSFQDPQVLRLAQRFVPVKLVAGQHREMVDQWKVPGWMIVFVTPATGQMIDSVSPENGDTLAQKMFKVYDQFRNDLFGRELAPKLEDLKASPKDLQAALRKIDAMVITRADASIARMLQRESLDPGVRKTAYQTLSVLSTPVSVEALLKLAGADKAAADALEKATPAATEILLTAVAGEDAPRRLIAYRALTKVAGVSGAKPDKFWETASDRNRQAEIDRVRDLARKRAKDWTARNEYR
jgi:hypothetical protein